MPKFSIISIIGHLPAAAAEMAKTDRQKKKRRETEKGGSWENFSQPGSAEMNASVAINYQICIMFTFLQHIVRCPRQRRGKEVGGALTGLPMASKLTASPAK